MMDSLSEMSMFVQVSASRSYAAAGRQLGMPASAVGVGVADMEARLAVSLFERGADEMALTPAGALFLERCRRILGEVEAAECELLHACCIPCGRLRVQLPPLTALLMPAVNGFLQRYPEIELDLDWSGHAAAVVDDDFDVVLSETELRDPRWRIRQLGSYAQLLVATPAYLQRRGLPQRPADLAGHACLRHKSPATGTLERWPLRRDGDGPLSVLPETVVSNTVEAVHYLALHGQGIALLPAGMVAEALASGALRTVLNDFIDDSVTFWIMSPAERSAAPKARVFIDYLAEMLRSV